MKKIWWLLGIVLIIAVIVIHFGGEPEYPASPQSGLAREPAITHDSATGASSMTVSVLIYNVAGLPWPVTCGKQTRKVDENGERIPIACRRSAELKKIGDTLGALRQQGIEPDIVLLQEAFIPEAAEIPNRGGYPNWVAGPGRSDTGPRYSARSPAEFIEERSFWKAEKLGKLQPSGLLVASNFPIVTHYPHPFNQWECGGYDCLANKGLLVAVLEVPGLPQRLAIATTHFNARRSTGVSNERALTAHNLQVEEANEFLEELDRDFLPFIWGGDLNMRHAPDRIEYFVERAGDTLNEVSSYCSHPETDCEVRIRWDSDTPWFETQDLQGWVSGRRVQIEPVRVEAVFDEPVDGVMPSDHDGLLVFYRLSWPTAEP